MSKRFSRQEFYELVWTEPLSTLAKKYNANGPNLAKLCAQSNIPVPGPGHWSKLRAGKKVTRRVLPDRDLGGYDYVLIDGGYDGYNHSRESRLDPLPPLPVFTEPLTEVRRKAEALVEGIAFSGSLEAPHPLIARLLAADEKRRIKRQYWSFSLAGDGPFLDTPFEQRRLGILNALFTGLEQCGMKPFVRGWQARELSVKVGGQTVPFVLDSVKAFQRLERSDQGYEFRARGHHDPMRLILSKEYSSNRNEQSWQDGEDGEIERFYREIAIEIIVSGEISYRNGEIHHYNWLVKRKAELEEKMRLGALERERLLHERQKQFEQACLDELLSQVNNLRQASEIRTYIKLARRANDRIENPMSPEEFDDWTQWAAAHADRIDPFKSGQFKRRRKNAAQ